MYAGKVYENILIIIPSYSDMILRLIPLSLLLFSDAKNMARDVNHALTKIAQSCGNMSEDGAAVYVKELRAQGRYQEDVWS